MSRKARTRAAAASAVALAIGLAFATGAVKGTWANFQAEAQNTNVQVAGGWIPAPSGLSDSISGSTTVSLSWTSGYSATAGTPGNHISGQLLQRADGKSGASPACGTYTTVGTVGQSAGSTTDGGGAIGDWWCYQMVSTTTFGWTTSALFPTPLLALVPTSFSTSGAGGSTSNELDSGDTITIDFNQAVSYSGSSTVTVCAFSAGVILIGDSTCASSSDTPTVGGISGLSISKSQSYPNSTVAVSGGSSLLVTIENGKKDPASGSGTYTAAGSAVTASDNGGGQQCTVSSTCTPSATVSF